jgi:hypothetical protein
MSDGEGTRHEAPPTGDAAVAADEVRAQSLLSRPPALGAAQRLFESAVVAVVTSTGLYLVGSVYVDAYFGRMSIDAASLDFSPPHVALQSAHVLQSLLEYPSTLVIFYLIYRALSSRMGRVREWFEQARARLGRFFLLLINGIIVSPLVIAAWEAGLDEGETGASSILGEVAGLMGTIGSLLVLYVIWLSFGPRQDIISQVRARKLMPIALLFSLYLLDALVATADGAASDAVLLMTGRADASTTVEITWTEGVDAPLPDAELILGAMRGGVYYVVERQSFPPSGRPVSYAVPVDSVDAVRLQRINDADAGFEEFFFEEMATPRSP